MQIRNQWKRKVGKIGDRGFTILELLVCMALIGLLAGIAWPRINIWIGAVRVRMAVGEVAGAMEQARLSSIKLQAKVALKFETAQDGTVLMTQYKDMDRDGVLNRDIQRGVDRLHKSTRRLSNLDGRIHFGFPYGEAPTEIGNPYRRISRLMDPIRFNRSDLASFNPLGTATPGTVYITDGYASLAAVRVDAYSGRISIWTYNRKIERWRVGG